ncbi:PREDICTED: pollen-specific leucine-rich repeat extensin-like protein 3 [Tarenaya hassleriana]|uniref:pollen-specific leucine-rich repeat extensin-like protein 3 n=1 Tax=Tarenaya hassleriana TaxID=28532 RepID=UPI00053C0E8C|nr:PREDICTED: pollen-specific leucine-rich repeat extensin-like protein 3 [Tarenaya hassleriana]
MARKKKSGSPNSSRRAKSDSPTPVKVETSPVATAPLQSTPPLPLPLPHPPDPPEITASPAPHPPNPTASEATHPVTPPPSSQIPDFLLPHDFPPLSTLKKPPPSPTQPGNSSPSNPRGSTDPPASLPQGATCPLAPPSPSPQFLWAKRLRATSRNLSRTVAPTYSKEGIPRIRVPSSVFMEASRTWEGYLICQFYGMAPSPSKVFQALNPIWGKKGKLIVRKASDSACLVRIPDLATREWVLEVGIWRVADVMFMLSEWTPVASLRKPTLSSAPIWVTLKHIPTEMYSLKGISYIVSGIGEHLHTDKMRLDPLSIDEARVKIEVQLGGPLPLVVEIEDDSG